MKLVRTAFVAVQRESLSDEERAAWEWLKQSQPESIILSLEELKNGVDRGRIDVLWWHENRYVVPPEEALDKAVVSAFIEFIRSGGGLFPTLLAAPYVCDIGLKFVRRDCPCNSYSAPYRKPILGRLADSKGKFSVEGLEVVLEAIPGKSYELKIVDPDRLVRSVRDGELQRGADDISIVRFDIPGRDDRYQRLTVRLLT
jgi:hypothetical protein